MTPDKFTKEEFWLDVGEGHKLYVQDWGNPKAKPIMFLHGGPGSGLKDHHKTRFDPSSQRVIFFDQRGSGKSTPYGSLKNNTTNDLINDINKIADRLKLKTFSISGGSWGSCLALAYAIKNPKRVTGMVLSGVFTASQPEIDWLKDGPFISFYPDVWQWLLSQTPLKHQSNPLSYHFKRALSGDDEAAKASAYVYECLESALMRLDDRPRRPEWESYDPLPVTIEIFYLVNKCFLPENYILKNASKLKLPVWIIQGRYDMVCPPITAYELHQRLPNARLIWTINGHLAEHEASNIIALAQEQVSQG